MSVRLEVGGFRSMLLVNQAYEEEGLECPDIDERVAPIALLYPRSYVEAVNALPDERIYDYSFVGSLYRPETFANRSWILDWARRRFTDRSYFLVTDADAPHRRIGSFDRTGTDSDVFVPKEAPPIDRARFHEPYFRVMRQSRFVLCPAGDHPWSMRFFEAVMCGALPVVSDLAHTGRNELERSIGYHVLRADDWPHRFDPEAAARNRRLFLEHQTLIGETT